MMTAEVVTPRPFIGDDHRRGEATHERASEQEPLEIDGEADQARDGFSLTRLARNLDEDANRFDQERTRVRATEIW
jgi:hypothetical protein